MIQQKISRQVLNPQSSVISKTKKYKMSISSIRTLKSGFLVTIEKVYKSKIIDHENNRPRVHCVNWNRKYDTTFESHSVWTYLQLLEKLKQHTVMTDDVDDLIQNAFENPAKFRFESSSSGLIQDLARLIQDLGDNNHADNILSGAEKDYLMKRYFPTQKHKLQRAS